MKSLTKTEPSQRVETTSVSPANPFPPHRFLRPTQPLRCALVS